MKINQYAAVLILIPLVVNGSVIFDSIIPDNSSCSEPKGYGCLCEGFDDCNQIKHFECIDYKCYCRNPLRNIYDNRLQQCVALVGSPCMLSEVGSVRCIRNSECDAGRCACQEGFTVTSKLMCMVTYGQECGPFQCNVERGLACKSGFCECLDSTYTYSAVSRSCFDPEAFVGNFLRSWFDRSFIRNTVISGVERALKTFIKTLTFPIGRVGILGG